MPYTVQNLIMDVIPRAGKLPESGITIYGAANSVLSLAYKRLLYRKSDLLAAGSMSLSIPAQGVSANLPADFVSFAEKPRISEALTDWMTGTVTSYGPTTGALVVSVVAVSGAGDACSTWNISLAAIPGSPASTVGTSVSTNTISTGAMSFTTQLGISGLTPGAAIIISTSALPSDLVGNRLRMSPEYLDDDDQCDDRWWGVYGPWGGNWDAPYANNRRRFKVLGTAVEIRPKPIQNAILTARYNAKPTTFTAPTDTVPWNGLFDEVFREGVVRILQKGVSIPDADPDFMAFIHREIDTVVNSRATLIPARGRTRLGNFM